MFAKIKSFLSHALIAVVVAGSVVVGGSVYAGLNGGISTPVFFYLDGVNLIPQVANYEIGSNTNRIAKIWADEGDFTNMVIGAITNGSLTIGGTNTTTIYGDGTTSTFGSSIEITGMVSSSAGAYITGDFTLIGDWIQLGDPDISGDMVLRGDLDMSTSFFELKTYSLAMPFPGGVKKYGASGPTDVDTRRFSNNWIEGDGGPITFTGHPTIPTHLDYNGKEICYQGNSDINTVTFVDNDVDSGTLLETSGNLSITLGLYDRVCFAYLLARNRWMQSSPFMNN